MAIAYVQEQGTNSGASNVTSITPTFASATAAGNLLVGGAAKSNAGVWTTPTNWTSAWTSVVTTNERANQSYKANSSASEANPAWSWVTAGHASAWCAELSGAVTVSPLDQTATNSAGAVVTTLSSGTTAATTGNGFAIAIFSFSIDVTSRTYTNSYTEREYQVPTSSPFRGMAVADVATTNGTTAETTASWTGSATLQCGIGVYKAASGSNFTQTNTGGVTPAGALVKADSKPIAGSAGTPAGALAKLDAKPLAGSAGTPTGSLVKLDSKALAGVLTPAGALVKAGSKALAGSIVPAGVLQKLAARVLAGAITAAGAIANVLSGAAIPVTAIRGTAREHARVTAQERSRATSSEHVRATAQEQSRATSREHSRATTRDR